MRTKDISARKKYDFLIIGSGIAGLSFALKVAQHGSVCVINKHKLDNTTTVYAQGGISSVTYQPDDFEKHVQDTLVAGAGFCNPDTVRMVVRSEEHTSELQSRPHLVCRLLLEKKKLGGSGGARGHSGWTR